MTKFKVRISEEVIYEIEVEAESEDDARSEAMAQFEDHPDINSLFDHVADRQIISVQEG